jgi:hypothetical protein
MVWYAIFAVALFGCSSEATQVVRLVEPPETESGSIGGDAATVSSRDAGGDARAYQGPDPLGPLDTGDGNALDCPDEDAGEHGHCGELGAVCGATNDCQALEWRWRWYSLREALCSPTQPCPAFDYGACSSAFPDAQRCSFPCTPATTEFCHLLHGVCDPELTRCVPAP